MFQSLSLKFRLPVQYAFTRIMTAKNMLDRVNSNALIPFFVFLIDFNNLVMAYDEFLTERIRQKFRELDVPFEDKKMMGGVCFLVNDKMCVGVVREKMMARIDPDKTGEAYTRKGCHEMDFTHRPMKGFIFIEPEGIDRDQDLEYFIRLALEYNPIAKSSKKKRA